MLFRLLATCLILFTLAATLSCQSGDFTISNVTVFDGDTLRSNVDVRVSKGRLLSIRPHRDDLADDVIIEGSGKLLLPGLINSHVHAYFPAHLQEAARAGVLHVLDMHGSTFSLTMLRGIVDSLNYAVYHASGGALTVNGGHGTQFGMPTPTVESAGGVEPFVRARKKEGVDYLKVIREPSRPTLDSLQLDTAIRAAHNLDLVVVAHISRAADAALLARLGIDGLAHLQFDRPLSAEELTVLAAAKPFVIPTLLTNLRAFDFFRENNKDIPHLDSTELLADVLKLYRAGLTILAGTDPPNFGINYGTDLYQELELLRLAGLPVTAVLRAATSAPAAAFHLPTGTGRLLQGEHFDALLVNYAIVNDFKLLNGEKLVWRRGVPVE